MKVTLEGFVPNAATRRELADLHRAADNLRPLRNKYAHGFWGRMPGEHKRWKVFYTRDTGDTFLLRRDVVDLQALKTTADQVRLLNISLRRFMRKHHIPPL